MFRLKIICEYHMIPGLPVLDHFMTAAMNVHVALTSKKGLHAGDGDVSLTLRYGLQRKETNSRDVAVSLLLK